MKHWRGVGERLGLKRREFVALLAITLVGAGLRVAALSAKSVWLDEAFSVWMAHHPLPDLWGWLVQIDHHPPLYYVLLHGWLGWFGDGPAAIRSLSALVSTLAIPLLAGAGRAWGGSRVGLAAGVALALSPWQIRYAQEARMYGLLVLAVAALLFALAHLSIQPAHARGRGGALWLLLVLSQAAAMLAHNMATVLLPLALNMGVAAAWLGTRRLGGLPELAHPFFLRRWITGQLAALAIWSVWASGFWRQVQVVDQGFWVQPPTWQTVADYARLLAAGFVPAGSVWAWGAVLLSFGLAVVGLATRQLAPGARWITVALLVAPPLLEAIASLRRPVFHLPSLLWTSLPFYLLVAAGWVALARTQRKVAWGAAVVLVALWGLGLRGYYVDFEKERWDLAAAHVRAHAAPGERVLFNATWVQLPFAYYLRERDLPLDLRGIPVDLFDGGVLEPAMTTDDLPRLEALVAGREVVWLVYSHNWYTDPQGLIPAALEARYAQADRFHLPEIEIVRYSAPREPYP